MNRDRSPSRQVDIGEVFRDRHAIDVAVKRAVARAVREAEAELGIDAVRALQMGDLQYEIDADGVEALPESGYEVDMTRVSLKTGKLLGGVLQVLGCAPGVSPAISAIGAAIGLGAEAAEFVGEYNQRKGRETVEKLKCLVASLDERLHKVEYQVTDTKQDFFVEVLKRCIEDDEIEKLPFYEAVLVWIAKDSPRAATVRIVGDAVKALSYVELWAFAIDGKLTAIRDVLQAEGITENVWTARLVQFGLIQQGVRISGRPQRLGEILLRELDAQSLKPPNAVAKRAIDLH